MDVNQRMRSNGSDPTYMYDTTLQPAAMRIPSVGPLTTGRIKAPVWYYRTLVWRLVWRLVGLGVVSSAA